MGENKYPKYAVERRTADEHFVMSIPGIDYSVGDEYLVLKEDRRVIAWAHPGDGGSIADYLIRQNGN